MINPDDDLASLLARAAEEQVTPSEWSAADGLGKEIAFRSDRAAGLSLGKIANSLNEDGVDAAHGDAWYPMTVSKVLDSLTTANKLNLDEPVGLAHEAAITLALFAHRDLTRPVAVVTLCFDHAGGRARPASLSRRVVIVMLGKLGTAAVAVPALNDLGHGYSSESQLGSPMALSA